MQMNKLRTVYSHQIAAETSHRPLHAIFSHAIIVNYAKLPSKTNRSLSAAFIAMKSIAFERARFVPAIIEFELS